MSDYCPPESEPELEPPELSEEEEEEEERWDVFLAEGREGFKLLKITFLNFKIRGGKKVLKVVKFYF